MLRLSVMDSAPLPVIDVVSEFGFESGNGCGEGVGEGCGPALAGWQQRGIVLPEGVCDFDVDETPVVVSAALCQQGDGVVAEEMMCDVEAEKLTGFGVNGRLDLIAIYLEVPNA